MLLGSMLVRNLVRPPLEHFLLFFLICLIGKFVPKLSKEAQSVLELNLPVTEGPKPCLAAFIHLTKKTDWTPIAFFAKAPTLIASISGVSLAGPELNRNEYMCLDASPPAT